MIPRIAPSCQTPSWQKQLASAITRPEDLFTLLNLPNEFLDAAKQSAVLFPLKVTLSYLERIEIGNIHDPLLRQILPLDKEQLEDTDYSDDPVGDINASVAPGILHKYQGRVLLMPTAACGIHCRYCFRRHFPYAEHKSSNNWLEAIEYIQNDETINEVILSGGDPLSLSNEKLFRLLDLISAIPHVNRIRFHSRYPIILPDRIDEALCNALQQHRCKIVMVIHCNHPNELSLDASNSLKRLKLKGITLLNQSVVLAGVNDSAATLIHLSELLFVNDVLPYYLHQLDKVRGAQHFSVSDAKALTLMNTLRDSLPGYLVPRLVRENSGELAKTPLL